MKEKTYFDKKIPLLFLSLAMFPKKNRSYQNAHEIALYLRPSKDYNHTIRLTSKW